MPQFVFFTCLFLSLPPFLLHSLFLVPVPSPTMERIRGLGIDLNALTSEFLPTLVSLPLDDLLSIREELFRSATMGGLAADGDSLVSRRDTRKNPLRHKLADDITSLLYCLKNNSKVPRSLLKNGKRSTTYLESSRQSELVSSQTNSTTNSHPPLTQPPPAMLLNDSVRLSTIMRDINLLRNDFNDLKREVSRLNHLNQSPAVAIDTCHIKVYFPGPSTPVLDPAAVSNLLGCPSLLVTCISPKSIKVKIPKSCLYKAMQSSDSSSHLVYVWKNHAS